MNILKIAIWTTTIIGLAPVTLLAILNLASNLSIARQMQNGAAFEQDDPYLHSYTYIQFGKALKLEVTSAIWPSICLIAGASACVVGLLFLIPRQTQLTKAGGFGDIQKYVERVLESRSNYSPMWLLLRAMTNTQQSVFQRAVTNIRLIFL
jgi:hypothetical protein